jgi:hypothetical protein
MRTAHFVTLLALVAAGCSHSEGPASDKAAAPAQSAAPAALTTAAVKATPSAAPTASAAAAPAEVPAYAAHKVVAGSAPDGTWTGPFEVSRTEGHLGLDYVKAMDQCVTEGKALCSETQWTRACEADASLAKIETWTASGMGDGRFVVRGGAGGTCSARNLAAQDASAPARGAVCCDRAIGIRTSNKNEAFLNASSQQMIDYEKALRDHDVMALASAYADNVKFLGKDYARDDLLKVHQKYFKAVPDQWTLFDTCDISIDKSQTDPRLQTDCKTIFGKKGKAYLAMQRFVRGGAPIKIQIIGDADSLTTNEVAGDTKETKERVGVLLLTE